MSLHQGVNSASWRDRANVLQEELERTAAERDELESRLTEIASIAAPDLNERAERIDQTLADLKSQSERQGLLLKQIALKVAPELELGE